MELRHLRYFVAVASVRNVSKAAKQLHVAQPALSRQIRDLEHEIGVSLLERTSRGVRLTDAGHVFATEARVLLARAEDAIKSTRATARGDQGELHLGYAPTPTAELLPRALHAFQNAAPNIRVILHDSSTGEILRGLRDRSLHLAIMVRPLEHSYDDLVFESMIAYPMCVALSPRHSLARRITVPLRRLLEEKLVVYVREEYLEYHSMLAEIFGPVGNIPPIAEECDSGPSLVAAVEAQRGVAIVPSVLRCLTGGRLKLRRLTPDPAPLIIGFAYSAENPSPAVLRFATTLRSLSENPG